jgi:hypothetical protein
MAKTTRRPPANEAMLGLISGYWVSQLVYVAAKLNVADELAKGPKSADVIAQRVGVDAEYLHRVLRALASVGVFAEAPDGRFRLTPAAQTLRSDRPGSLRNFALMMVDDYNWQAWSALGRSVATGTTAFDHVFGLPFFPYLQQHPDKERVFAASMASISGTENAGVAGAYPFGGLTRLVDVGGAHGHLLATILRKYKKLEGVLYDRPQVVASAPQSGFITPALQSRCEIVGGDFFASVPAGGDAYIMKYIIHDWNDAQCGQILGNCRAAMAPGGRVLVVDHVIPKGNGASWAKLLDINMMVLPGGKERTRAEFQALFERSGLRLKRIYPTKTPLSILEGVAA